MTFGRYLSNILKKGSILENENYSATPISIAKNFAKTVGGDPADQNDLSIAFESIEKSLDTLSFDYFEDPTRSELTDLFTIFIDSNRLDFVEKYSEAKERTLIQIIEDLERLDIAQNSSKYLALNQIYFLISERLLKLHKLLSAQLKKIESSGKIEESIKIEDSKLNKLKNTISILEKSMTHLNRLAQSEENRINAVPENEYGENLLNAILDLHKQIGIFNELQNKVETKKNKIQEKYTGEDQSTKGKKRIINRIIRAISLAKLPSISNGKIDSPGDYFKLFKALEKENPSWMDLSLNTYVFGKKSESLADFKATAASTESAKEEDQLTYLAAARSWSLTFIKSDTQGKLLDKVETNLVSSLENTAREKEREIKNYYTAREFNLGNFGGIQLKPEIRLTLYVKTPLTVSEEDRLKESPLRNMIKGIGNMLKGLFSAVQDTGDESVAQLARQRNIAVFNGINSIIRGAVTLVGGKQAGRDYEKTVPDLGKKNTKIKEDMLAPIGMAAAPVINPEQPGQFMQTPDSIAGEIDTYSLLGPSKSKSSKKKKRKQSAAPVSNRVASFSDFINRK